MNSINAVELEVNGIKYIRADSINIRTDSINIRADSIKQQPAKQVGDWKIIILQRGWIYVGRLERDGNECKLHQASNIRLWGTTKGLGELVNGPLTTTKLDKCNGVVEFNYLTVVCTLAVNPEKWS